MARLRPLEIIWVAEPLWPWGAIVVALLAIFFIYQVSLIIRTAVIPMLRVIPVIGNQLTIWADQGIVAAANAVHGWAEQALAPLTQSIRRIDNRLRNYARVNTLTHQATLAALRRIRYDVIPRIQAIMLQLLQQRIAQTVALLQAVQAQLQIYARQAGERAVSFAYALHQQALQQVAQARTEARTAALALADYARQLTQLAMVRADQEVERAAKLAALEDASVAAYAQQLAGQGLTFTQQQVARTQQYAQLLSQQDRDYTAALGSGLAVAVATMGSGLGNRITKIETSDCQQECQPLGQLGRELRALDMALLIAIVAACVAKPNESAKVAAAVLGPISDEAVQLTDHVLGRA